MTTQRIVSLVPSLTELVCWLGCEETLVGRTRFCEEPASTIQKVPTVGGTKNPDVAAITATEPDLVIANQEENRREDVEALRKAGLNVLVTNPNSMEETLAMILNLGVVLRQQKKATELVEEVRAVIGESGDARKKALFVPIWQNPLMGLAGDTYGNALLIAVGAENILAGESRYPELTWQEVEALSPEAILLPDEPFPFTQQHVPKFASIAPTTVVDGKLLWWYGPRIPEAIRELRRIIAELPT